MSESLQAFYDEYAAWLVAGAPEGGTFHRGYGLCRNIYYWASRNNPSAYNDMLFEMRDQFVVEIGPLVDKDYPFGGGFVYVDDMCTDMCYLNPDRREWVFSHMSK